VLATKSAMLSNNTRLTRWSFSVQQVSSTTPANTSSGSTRWLSSWPSSRWVRTSSICDTIKEESVLMRDKTAKQQAQNRNTRVPRLILQDPAFCTADHRLLSGLGAQVVEDPIAFVLIDEKTLVFAKHIPLVVYFKGLLQTSPAVCISTVSLFSLYTNNRSED
jgi:hypothetical protein